MRVLLSSIIKIVSLFALFSFPTTIKGFRHLKHQNLYNRKYYSSKIMSNEAMTTSPLITPILISKDNLTKLFTRYNKLSVIKQRAVASIVGSAVADAATRPVHWLYDRTKLESIISPTCDSAFWSESLSPFYTLPTGRRSCYNDLGFVMLRSLSSDPTDTPYMKNAYFSSIQSLFLSPSEYAEAMARRVIAYDPAKRLEDRQPVPGPWQQGAVTNLLKCLEEGRTPDGSPQSKESDGLCTTLPLIARLSSSESTDGSDISTSTLTSFLTTIQFAASVISSNDTAMTHTLTSALILRKIIHTGSSALTWTTITECASTLSDHTTSTATVTATTTATATVFNTALMEEIRTELMAVRASYDSKIPFVEACESYGKACAYPGAFQGASFALLTAVEGDKPLSFADLIRQVIRVGGCNCSRANMVGACLGAAYGFQEASFKDITTNDIMNDSKITSLGMPTEWLLKTDKIEEIFNLALVKIGEV